MRHALMILCAMVAWIGLAACDEPFQPFEESDRDISVFGALDVSADTQWVRVTPVRNSILTDPGPLGVTVSLERPADGRTVQLRDSMVQFHGVFVEDAASLFTHNYWTTEPIEPGGTYTLTVEEAENTPAAATVSIPLEYSVSVTYSSVSARFADLRTQGVEHLGLVLFRRHLPPGCAGWKGPPWYHAVSFRVLPPESGVYRVAVTSDLGVDIEFPCAIVRQDLLVVASGAPWPAGLENAPFALGVPNQPSNVMGGFGFLGGILSKDIPWEPCGTEPFASGGCTLLYEPTSVTLAGRVTVASSGVSLPGAEIRLTEIVPDSVTLTRNRGSTDGQGSYEIGAVRADVDHVFRISHPTRCGSSPESPPTFLDHVDTLTALAPASRTTVNVALERNPACNSP